MNGNLTSQEWHQRFLQQARWTRELRKYILHQIGLTNGGAILEVGCGTGAILSEFRSIYRYSKSLQIHGLDINPYFLELAERNVPEIALCLGDAHFLPYSHKYFDFVFCHYLLMWVSDPLKVLMEMARVTKSGGCVAALAEPDYGGRIDYPEEFKKLGELQCIALQNQGGNPLMGRRLASLFKEAGIHSFTVGVFGGQWSSSAVKKEEIDAEWNMIVNDISGLITPNELSELYNQDLNCWMEGNRILYVPTFYAWGRV